MHLVFALLACHGPKSPTDSVAVVDSKDSSVITDDSSGAPGFDETWALFAGSCDGCHSGPSPQGELDLSGRDLAYAALVGQPARGPRCADPPHTLVVPGDVDGSLLYAKLAMIQDCGLGMPGGEPPRGQPPFTEAQLAVVAAWIAGGALDEGS